MAAVSKENIKHGGSTFERENGHPAPYPGILDDVGAPEQEKI
jgi:hypothetical protein